MGAGLYLAAIASVYPPRPGRHADHRKHRTTDGGDPFEGKAPVAMVRVALTTTLTGAGQAVEGLLLKNFEMVGCVIPTFRYLAVYLHRFWDVIPVAFKG
jgi:hypothetical protein